MPFYHLQFIFLASENGTPLPHDSATVEASSDADAIFMAKHLADKAGGQSLHLAILRDAEGRNVWTLRGPDASEAV